MLLALALSVVALGTPQDSVRVEASLSTSRIATGETTVLVISVDTDGATPSEIPVPVLPPGLELGPISDYSQLQVSFPGGRRRITRREIVLAGREPGDYRIPPVNVEVAGGIHATAPLALVVVPGSAAPEDREDSSLDAVQLRAWARPDSVWVGEQVFYQAEALFPEELRLRQARSPVFEPPASTGFWAYDLADAVAVALRIIDGEAYEAQTFRQVFFPLGPGDFTLPPARMQFEVRQGFAFTPVRREIASGPVTVHVRPLPAAPAGFQGAVGRYTVRAELSQPRVGPGEPASLRLIVEGTGNVKGLPRPELPPIEGAEVYPAAEDTRVGFADGVISGRKLMEWTVVPQETGAVEVPGVRYVWFDPAVGDYRSASTLPLRLEVARETGGVSRPLLAPLRGRSHVVPLGWTRSPAFAAAQLVPLVLLALADLARRVRRRAGRATPGPEPGALARAAALVEDPRACLDEIARYAAGHPSPQAAALRERVRAARYAPEPPTRAQCELLLAAARRLDAGTPLRVLAAPLLLLLAVGTLQTGPFERGVAAFGREDYEAAGRAFAERIREAPRDAAAWYNLGNAWLLEERRGPATWAWLEALKLRPRDDWARRNLRFAGAEHALELAPLVPLSSDELRLIAAALWWALVLVGAHALRRRRRRAALLATLAFLLLLPALGTLAARALRAPRAVTLMETALRAAPIHRAEPLAQLPAAEPIVILERRGDWVLGRAWDLREGWVEQRALGRL